MFSYSDWYFDAYFDYFSLLSVLFCPYVCPDLVYCLSVLVYFRAYFHV